ncbi:hypothetical protein V5799_027992 [Amblyomma americanum]|uniref:Reverse transcriptase domain-containing protein n=1 Tax=Amblyomma americanum TaxID=6943 RepID=A0AAQ4DE51_AMBAM
MGNLKDLYGISTAVLGFENSTRLVHPSKGLLKADPISPLHLVLDEWLRRGGGGIAFESNGLVSDAIAFADDVVLLATTPQELRHRITSFVKFLEEKGLRVNPGNYLTVALQPSGCDKMRLMEDAVFTVNGDPILAATTTTEWRYLGLFYALFGQERPS